MNKPETQPGGSLKPVGSVAGMIDLQNAVADHVLEMDNVMQVASSYERGRRIARLVSKLQEALTESQKPQNH